MLHLQNEFLIQKINKDEKIVEKYLLKEVEQQNKFQQKNKKHKEVIFRYLIINNQ